MSAVAPSHDELLVIARAVRRAVVEEDDERVRAGLVELRDALARHLQAERRVTATLPAMDRYIAAGGQQRLLDLIADVLAAVSAGTDDCPCLVRTAQLDAALRRQILLETHLLDHPGPPGHFRA